ncbi:hypothetical protein NPIL_95241 [Nephila pilipes]|uniref:Secreted protein n=1 Tax=Nephila pilipes TaxID=299642 RepID=A0A8X6P5Z9_NEPPI|nr:hypothetical protein NPIL_95241 [Nephila pilipes]
MMLTHIIPILTAVAIIMHAAKGQSTSVSALPQHSGHKHSNVLDPSLSQFHHCHVLECISSVSPLSIRIQKLGTALYVKVRSVQVTDIGLEDRKRDVVYFSIYTEIC